MAVTFRTFLYGVRDGTALRLKYGYQTALDLESARVDILGRYRVCYFHCEVLHVVPVAVRGKHAEDALKARLRKFHLGREFFEFPDEATLQTTLREAYSALACAEDQAHKKQSHRGDAALRAERRREKAEIAAQKDAEIRASRKRSLELTQAREESKRTRIETHTQRLQKQQVCKQQEDTVLNDWLRDHLDVSSSVFILKRDVEKRVSVGGIRIPPKRLKQCLEAMFASQGVQCREQHYSKGVRYRSAWVGLRWKDIV